MRNRRPLVTGSKYIEDLHDLRLMSLLQELLEERGKMATARTLGINYKTLANSIKAGKLSKRVRSELEKALMSGVGSAAAEQRERNDELENRIDKFEETIRSSLKELRVALEKLRKDHVRQRRRVAVLAQGREGPDTGTPIGDQSGGSATKCGPPWWRPRGLSDRPPASVMDLILEWRQALTSLMAAEERLSTAVEWDVGLLVDRDDMVEAPTEPRIPRSARSSRRKLAHSETDERTRAAPE